MPLEKITCWEGEQFPLKPGRVYVITIPPPGLGLNKFVIMKYILFSLYVSVPPERELFKRRRKKVNYREEEDLDDDDYICELSVLPMSDTYVEFSLSYEYLSEVLGGLREVVDNLLL